MEILDTPLEDLKIIIPKVHSDERGYFFETYNKATHHKMGLNYEWVQDNQSSSKYGVIRGLHYQLHPHAQAKLVRVLLGNILDVAVDLRKNSPTFGEWHGVVLNHEEKNMLLIPRGFAHGFSVLSESAVILYKCDGLYDFNAESGIQYNDPRLNIDWKIPDEHKIISEKDKKFPPFSEARMNF